MKKYLLLYQGRMESRPEVMAAVQAWFARVGDRIVDSGNPLGTCLEITPTGRREVSPEEGAATGYSIISAESREDAERLLDGCPMATSVRVYEAMPM